jgi:opacity protein-like surface antigen
MIRNPGYSNLSLSGFTVQFLDMGSGFSHSFWRKVFRVPGCKWSTASGSIPPGLFLWLLIFLLFPISLHAQIFNAGLSGGVSISQIDGDGFSGYNKAGAAFGLFVNTGLRESLTAQFEVNYCSKGSQYKTTSEDLRYYRIELHYIEFPVLIMYSLAAGFIAETGLSGGYLFRAKERDATGGIPSTADFRKTELAFLGGISYSITEKVLVSGRLSYSVFPIRAHSGGGTYLLNRGQNNNVVSFSLRYQF